MILTIEARAPRADLVKWGLVSVAGLALVGLNTAFRWAEVFLYLGFGAAALGIGMVIMAHEKSRKLTVRARVDAEGYVISSGRNRVSGKWSEISRITYSDHTVTMHRKDQQNFSIILPPGANPEEMDVVAEELRSLHLKSRA